MYSIQYYLALSFKLCRASRAVLKLLIYNIVTLSVYNLEPLLRPEANTREPAADPADCRVPTAVGVADSGPVDLWQCGII